MAALGVVGALFAILAAWFLWRMLHSLRHGRVVRAGGSCVGCCTSTAIAAAAGLVLLSYLSYSRLVEEQLVSRIEFRRTGPGEFEARLMVPERRDRFFRLVGDEWQMDARIVTWKPPLTMLGLDPIYHLDRLSGRYADAVREQTEARTVYDLAPEIPADLWTAARRFPRLMPGVDAHYGTATFVPMADGARYDVTLSRDALIARPANDAAREAVGAWGRPAGPP